MGGKALVLLNPTELEIFWQDFVWKALDLVNSEASTESFEWFYFGSSNLLLGFRNCFSSWKLSGIDTKSELSLTTALFYI